jgi:hypothetical protein
MLVFSISIVYLCFLVPEQVCATFGIDIEAINFSTRFKTFNLRFTMSQISGLYIGLASIMTGCYGNTDLVVTIMCSVAAVLLFAALVYGLSCCTYSDRAYYYGHGGGIS